jgi:hypothetical protein
MRTLGKNDNPLPKMVDYVDSIGCEGWTTKELVQHLTENDLVSDNLFIMNSGRDPLYSEFQLNDCCLHLESNKEICER